jgi:UPF0271 protein
MGESTSLWPYTLERDLSLLPFFSSINIACGFHAGDADTILQVLKAAGSLNISVGAHPSFPDRENFGRKEMYFDEKDLYRIVYQQIEFISSLAITNGIRIRHVKPHGALYNLVAKDHRLAFIVCSAIQAYDPDLLIYGLAGSQFISVADCLGMKTCNEVFADRTYQDDGSLTPRSETNALIDDPVHALEQVLELVTKGTVMSVNGKTLPLTSETVCIHSDGKYALHFAKIIHEALLQQGITISHP